MGLSSLDGESLVHRRAQRDLVPHTGLNSGNRNRARLTAAHDRLTKHMNSVGREKRCLLHFVQTATVEDASQPTASTQLSGPRLLPFTNTWVPDSCAPGKLAIA